MAKIYLIVHNVRSAHNVGSLLRSADGLGVAEVFLTGYSPYPMQAKDSRLPHLAAKTDRAIQKTALGAEKTIEWQYQADVISVINKLKSKGVAIAALEQTDDSVKLPDFKNNRSMAIIVGSERTGLPEEVLAACDLKLEIPMLGQKESFNVAVAGAIALYQLRYGL